jgi:uncharacterized protein YqjF (DUF2071 family)
VLEHRTWPVPAQPWAQAQTWVEHAFLHWRLEPRELERLLPGSVELEVYDDSAWLGITAFLLTGLRLRGLPPLPGISSFPEVSVRTYVTRDGTPGLWYFSLDAGSTLAVEAAKRAYRLPYARSQMRYVRHGDRVHLESARAGAAFSADYGGTGDAFTAGPGTLEAFLAERYCIYTEDGGRVYRAEFHHPPWPLQRGETTVDVNTITPMPLPVEPAHVLFSPRQDVVVWPLRELT